MRGNNFLSKKRNAMKASIDPDEIFLDSANLPDFDTYQFEGILEKPISKKTFFMLGIFFVCVGVIFVARIASLQVASGAAFAEESENNRLRHLPIFPERGVIYDRNGIELAWNSPRDGDFSKRSYADMHGLAHIIGYVGYPATDSSGLYYQKNYVGKDGAEKYYDDLLAGEAGTRIVETDAFMNTRLGSIIYPPTDGESITLSVDARMEEKMYDLIALLIAEYKYTGGAGVIMDIKTGEIIALASVPEYSSSVMTEGDDISTIRSYQNDRSTPFLNRAVSGLYTPGSTVKPFVAVGVLEEKVVTPDDKIVSAGSISVPNPYFPDQFSVFNDWKAHGPVDIKEALAVSSDVYFYEVGGGFKTQKGIGIAGIEKYARLFGFGDYTDIDLPGDVDGVIPNPEWKLAMFNGDPWRVGDTYHTVIGQYGFQVSPVQMVRGIAAIANGGALVTPHVRLGDMVSTTPISGVNKDVLAVVRDGMRLAVTHGTAKGLDLPYINVAAKTGTAEIGTANQFINSWVVGFFPYENPHYAFTVVMEQGPHNNTVGGLYVMRQFFEWMAINMPEYVK